MSSLNSLINNVEFTVAGAPVEIATGTLVDIVPVQELVLNVNAAEFDEFVHELIALTLQ